MSSTLHKLLVRTGWRDVYTLAVSGTRASAFHTSSKAAAGENYRLRHGLARSGNEYGPLTDIPDWSFADGRPAPVNKAQRHRNKRQYAIGLRIKTLLKEMDDAKAASPSVDQSQVAPTTTSKKAQ